MIDIIHRVGIKASPSRVYAALSTVEGVAGWWTTATTGVSKPGATLDFEFKTRDGGRIGGMTMQVMGLDPDKQVHWRCTAGPDEWIGTDVVFRLVQEDDYTIVRFGHRNWREAVEFTEHCSMKWAIFLLSLKQLVETGEGRPSPDDIKIDNWN
ncbi:SRPBCC family protein [Pseudoxanthomonas sacheonensis]|uniref:SRPBCC family protein n=1 Tax=Pseudoxanthomonas sacheonensis TaxID=443615 RepID=UPI0013D8DA6D|nr:SRPBCC domain-containing protein [Pseudoxanthomonas sacheonensis]KAF1707080.1 polyketide cyclase [Pseudoxanthomonas sacheonensis]